MTQLILCGLLGCIGALLMFAGDLILYLPSSLAARSTRSYFETIDPNGEGLHDSPMRHMSDQRLMLGGILGPVSSLFYTLGFSQANTLFVRLDRLLPRSIGSTTHETHTHTHTHTQVKGAELSGRTHLSHAPIPPTRHSALVTAQLVTARLFALITHAPVVFTRASFDPILRAALQRPRA